MSRLEARAYLVGDGTEVRRMLPQRTLRTVGPWCFADHYGPDDVTSTPGMQVPPHPHTGLQTVSWLLEGAIVHRDSLGSLQRVEARELSLMTSGAGITHSEESPRTDRPAVLSGVQLWVALPDGARNGPAAYEHHTDLPTVEHGDLSATVVLGDHVGVRSPGLVFSPLVGLDVAVSGSGVLPLATEFEHAAFVLTGSVAVDGDPLEVGQLLDLGRGRDAVTLEGSGQVMVLGGEPFDEALLLWWNFVCRTPEEVEQAREQWQAGAARFGEVKGYEGRRLDAPRLGPGRLKPRR